VRGKEQPDERQQLRILRELVRVSAVRIEFLRTTAPNVREKLSGSAAALFQRFGYVHVSIRHITWSIDIPKGTFYNHFKSKEALASAILSEHFDALMEALGQSGSETAGASLGGTSSP
jgi:AcrR family transcriptional regulator